jgi:hypothetical protein
VFRTEYELAWPSAVAAVSRTGYETNWYSGLAVRQQMVWIQGRLLGRESPSEGGRNTTSEMDRDLLGLSEETLRLLEVEPPSDMGKAWGDCRFFAGVTIGVLADESVGVLAGETVGVLAGDGGGSTLVPVAKTQASSSSAVSWMSVVGESSEAGDGC